MEQNITWKSILDNLHSFKLENSGDEKIISSSRMTRMGLELSGFILRKESSACILFGKEEYVYLSNFDKKTRDSKIEAIFKLKPPLVIVSRSFPVETILDLARKYKIAVFSSDLSSSEINTLVNLQLLKLLSKTQMMHGNLVEMFGVGVLILGESGIGKSEITLELIKKGHIFISDDAVVYYRVFDKIIGKSSEFTKNLIEIRGIGIIDISKVYGIQQIKSETSIDIIIELSMLDKNKTYDRLGKQRVYKNISGINIPYYCVPISPGRNISDIIEVIINRQKLIDTTGEEDGNN